MAKSSVNKVARAAAAGGRTQVRPGDRPLFFPLGMALVVIIGIVFVVLARNERVSNADNSAPRLGDHWHSAYEVNVCGEVQPAMPNDDVDRTGIHSHGDGLIHIHPFLTTATGGQATLGTFFNEGGYEISDTTLRTNSVDIDTADFLCGDEPSELVVLKWVNVSADDPLVIREDLASVKLDNLDPARGQLFSIAVVPVDADLDFAELKPDRTFLEQYIDENLDDAPLEEPSTTDAPTTTVADESTESTTTTVADE